MAEKPPKKKHGDGFSEFDREFGRVRGEMEDLMERMMERIHEEDFHKLGALGAVHGFSIRIGADGKPIVREFGNVKPEQGELPISGEREPLVDVIEGKADITVMVELPGVERKDILAKGEGRTLKISVNTEARKYYKELELPAAADFPGARAKYNNGVLEIVIAKDAKGAAGKIEVG